MLFPLDSYGDLKGRHENRTNYCLTRGKCEVAIRIMDALMMFVSLVGALCHTLVVSAVRALAPTDLNVAHMGCVHVIRKCP